MKVFGLGTLSSMSSIDRYARFTHSLYGIYSTMEEELDLTTTRSDDGASTNDTNGATTTNEIPSASSIHLSPPTSGTSPKAVTHFWKEHSAILRRADKLKHDLNTIGKSITTMKYSPATLEYMNCIHEAGKNDRKNGSAKLLGHAYTRYLADLMGGQVLATPTRLALGLDVSNAPTQYAFDLEDIGMTRKEYVEKIYHDLNTSGTMLMKTANSTSSSNEEGEEGLDSNGGANYGMLDEVVDEARAAFMHNIHVYSEEPIYMDSLIGVKNILYGWVSRR